MVVDIPFDNLHRKHNSRVRWTSRDRCARHLKSAKVSSCTFSVKSRIVFPTVTQYVQDRNIVVPIFRELPSFTATAPSLCSLVYANCARTSCWCRIGSNKLAVLYAVLAHSCWEDWRCLCPLVLCGWPFSSTKWSEKWCRDFAEEMIPSPNVRYRSRDDDKANGSMFGSLISDITFTSSWNEDSK